MFTGIRFNISNLRKEIVKTLLSILFFVCFLGLSSLKNWKRQKIPGKSEQGTHKKEREH